MATADEIPTDLALEIGIDLAPKDFTRAAREFFAFVERVSRLANSQERLEWRVKVRQGSNIIALHPAETVLADEASAAYSHVAAATQALASGNLDSPDLDDEALEHAKRLSDVGRANGTVIPIRIWIRREPTIFGPEIGDSIREEGRTSYSDFGTLEGTLNAIHDANGSLELRIRDYLWLKPIKCHVKEDMLGRAMESFRRRVEVGGEIFYSRNGIPTSINVERLEPLPSDADLPSIEQVHGILGSTVN